MVFGMASISLGGWLMASDEAFLRRTSMQVWQAIGLQMQPYKGGRSPSQGGPTKPSTTYPPNYTLDQRVQRYGTGEARPQQFVQTPTISGHKTTSVSRRYNVVTDAELQDGTWMNDEKNGVHMGFQSY